MQHEVQVYVLEVRLGLDRGAETASMGWGKQGDGGSQQYEVGLVPE